MELIKPDTNINFLGNRRYAYLFSAVLAVVSLLSIPVMGKIKLGIDFTGGAMIHVKFAKPVKTQEIREALEPMGQNFMVQEFVGTEDEFVIRTEAPEDGADEVAGEVKKLLEAKVGAGNVEIRGQEMVGPKVGKDLQSAAWKATIFALAFVFIYVGFIRFGMSMALGAIICLVHDLIMVYGIFVWLGKEFNLTILAAILTGIGYDVNDTIVVCDRIRENIPLMRSKPLEEILNLSINQTLSRTLLTSVGTLLVIVALMIVGTEILRDFALALTLGIVFGTYSSIFVAAPLVLAWERIVPVKRA